MLTYYQSRIALGSHLNLTLVSDAGKTVVDELFRQLWLVVFEFERRCSRFLPDSELSQFNRAAGGRQPISPEFRAVLRAATEMAVLSDGLYNSFILPALQKAGYTHSMVAAHRHDEVDDYSERSVVPADHLEIGDTWARIPYGTAIDIGGCGKGYAGDLLADLADTFPELSGYWFSLGGDIVTGGLDEGGRPWVVYVEDASSKRHAMAGKVELAGTERCAVATSSVLSRKGTKAGKAWHHIIDPRTGQPSVSDTIEASICARSALLADVLASCSIILNAEQVKTYVKAKGAEGALLQAKDQTITYWGVLVPWSAVRKPTPIKKTNAKIS